MYKKLITRFRKTETLHASFLLLIPLVLITATGEVRESISDYVYSDQSLLFSGLLWFAASMFMYNGTVNKKWYNTMLGLSLIGIALTPHEDYTFLHYGFASLFFIGSVAVMIIYSSTDQRIYKIIAGAFILIAMALHFVFNTYSLLVAEWIGLLPISLHFILESNGKIN